MTESTFKALFLFLVILTVGLITYIRLTDEKWKQFERCSGEFPSDEVCDSCYKVTITNN